ncbi:hypothetical protein BDK92_0292 [Micromonospora pisi]|uniref:Uncharacterized protein n=1 Tax=Micromonospora pisi TaxID=589240 RepID=A0A495JBF8_9ACTN|nr:hypothetical protein BDK92_0292 [Micromonospora pisi]
MRAADEGVRVGGTSPILRLSEEGAKPRFGTPDRTGPGDLRKDN